MKAPTREPTEDSNMDTNNVFFRPTLSAIQPQPKLPIIMPTMYMLITRAPCMHMCIATESPPDHLGLLTTHQVPLRHQSLFKVEAVVGKLRVGCAVHHRIGEAGGKNFDNHYFPPPVPLTSAINITTGDSELTVVRLTILISETILCHCNIILSHLGKRFSEKSVKWKSSGSSQVGMLHRYLSG